MSISKTLIVTLNQDKSKPKEKFFIYRNDVGVDMYIELSNLTYQFDNKRNNFKYANAVFRTPEGKVFTVDYLDIVDNKVVFSFTPSVIKNMQVIGKYEVQFQLYDANLNRVTIPPITLEVKEPIGQTTLEIEEAVVDYAYVGKSMVARDIKLFAMEDGYIKTVWETGDLITASKLNNLESGVEYLFNKIGDQSLDSETIFNNTNRISKLEKNMTTVTQNISTINNNVKSLREDVNTVKEDIDWIKENGSGGNVDITYKSTEPSTIDFGGIKTGYLPPEEGINILDLIDQAMHPYIYKAPSISFSINPSTTLYELGIVVKNLKLIANVTKGKEEITEVGILQGGVLLDKSNNSFTKTIEEVKANTSFNAYVTDDIQRVNSNTIYINFINPIYIGALTDITEEQIKTMTKKVVNVGSQSYTYTIDTKRMCIAVPSNWSLKSIIDPNNFNITESFIKTNVNITCLDGVVRPYTVYYSDYTSQSNFTVKFNF